MRVHFWGTRGSLPAATESQAIRDKIKRALRQANGRHLDSDAELNHFIDNELAFPIRGGYGGNSSCVEIVGGDRYTLCDMGSGLRRFSEKILRERGPGQPLHYNFFMSHVHWDHIMGFPFFAPAYIPGNVIRIHGAHDLALIEEAFRRQHANPCFPVQWEQLRATIEFIHLDADRWHDIDGLRVKAKLQPHPSGSYGYRFEAGGKSVVYSTDGEHRLESEPETEAMVEFYRAADLVIFDSMYSLSEMIDSKRDWGHSSNTIGADLCLRARAKHYCMFHHEPAYDDDTIYTILSETRRYAEIVGEGYPLQVTTAYDGLDLEV